MEAPQTLLTPAGWAIMGLYLASLLALGAAGRIAQKERTLSDFYLGGRRMGFAVLLLTLYATQYSGNTLIGFAASGYRQGFLFLVSVTFMMGVVGIYLLYAPALYALSRVRQYLTLSDYIQDRYRLRVFSVLVSVSGIVAMGNYILSNLKAIGYGAEMATGGSISFAEGIIYLSLIILIYETLGGLRSVAWTDVVQGLILLVGCAVILGAILIHFDGWNAVTERLKESKPDFWRILTWDDSLLWFSTLLVVSVGIAFYPHAVQRIYAAKSALTLRRAFQVMLFMPLFTTLFMVTVGIIGAAQFPDLSQIESENITLRMLQQVAAHVPGTQIIVMLFLAAVFAAIMSTIDSALLAISSMITQDLYRPLNPGASESHLTTVGKGASWLVMLLVVPLAIGLPQTIWRLIEIKLELLIQIAPAVLLGLHLPRLGPRPVFMGFVAGTVLTLYFAIGSALTDAISPKPGGVHAGLVGLGANLAVILAAATLSRPNKDNRFAPKFKT